MSIVINKADMIRVMSPSVQKVYLTIKSRKGKPLRVSDIEKCTRYSPRTIRQALNKLKRMQLIVQIPDMRDMRSHFYVICQ